MHTRELQKRSRRSMILAARTRSDARESCSGRMSHRRRRSVAYSAGACALRRGAPVQDPTRTTRAAGEQHEFVQYQEIGGFLCDV
jgi:hypothetical protein